MKANKDSQLANTIYRVNAFKSLKKVRHTANHNQLRYILAGQEVIGDPGIVIDDLTRLFMHDPQLEPVDHQGLVTSPERHLVDQAIGPDFAMFPIPVASLPRF